MGEPPGEGGDPTSSFEGLLSHPPAPVHQRQDGELTPKGGMGRAALGLKSGGGGGRPWPRSS